MQRAHCDPSRSRAVISAAFMRLVMRTAGYPDLPSGDPAWACYGRPSAP